MSKNRKYLLSRAYLFAQEREANIGLSLVNPETLTGNETIVLETANGNKRITLDQLAAFLTPEPVAPEE